MVVCSSELNTPTVLVVDGIMIVGDVMTVNDVTVVNDVIVVNDAMEVNDVMLLIALFSNDKLSPVPSTLVVSRSKNQN